MVNKIVYCKLSLNDIYSKNCEDCTPHVMFFLKCTPKHLGLEANINKYPLPLSIRKDGDELSLKFPDNFLIANGTPALNPNELSIKLKEYGYFATEKYYECKLTDKQIEVIEMYKPPSR